MIFVKRFCIVVLVLLFCPWQSWGDESRLVPFIGAKEEYNGNILMVTEAQGVNKDFVSILSPGVEMVDRTDRLDTDLSAQLDRVDYSHYRGLSATNQSYSGKFAYRATPLLTFSAGAGYTINANPTLDIGTGRGIPFGTTISTQTGTATSPTHSNPPAPDPSGTTGTSSSSADSHALQGNTTSIAGLPVVSLPLKRFTTSLSANYQLTEKTSAITSYNFVSDHYEKPSYRDTSHDVNTGLVYDLGSYLPLVKGRLNVDFSSYYLPDSRTYSTACIMGLSRDIDEAWSASVDVGIRRTWSEIFVSEWVPNTPDTQQWTRVRHDNHSWGWVASASLNYQGERIQENLAYVRDLSLASGLNGAAERNAFTLTTQYRLTYEFSGLFAASYSQYKSDSSNYSANVIDQRTYDGSAGFRYEFSRDTAVDVSYDYTLVRYPISDANAYRQLVFINLRTQFPFLE